MLSYQSSSFHDALYLRRVLNKPPAPEFAAWLERMGLADSDGNLIAAEHPHQLPATMGPILGLLEQLR
jgi:ethanolamine ammonia-lyase large subunit